MRVNLLNMYIYITMKQHGIEFMIVRTVRRDAYNYTVSCAGSISECNKDCVVCIILFSDCDVEKTNKVWRPHNHVLKLREGEIAVIDHV